MDLYSSIAEKEWSGVCPPVCSFAGVHDLPATLADTGCRHCVSINPALALRSNVDSAAFHPMRIDLCADFTNSDFLLAATAFLVWQNLISSCDGLIGQHR